MRLFITVISLLSFSVLSFATPALAERIDSIAAVVNGKAVTCYQVNRDKQIMIEQFSQSGQATLPNDSILNVRALESRIKQTLQQQEATKLGLSIPDEEIDNAMANVEEKNNIPAGQLPEILKAQGVDIEEYRETFRERLLASKLINVAVRGNLKISEESMREYYRKHLANPKPVREVQLAQVFIALPSSPTPEQFANKQQKAHGIYDKLINGADFKRTVALKSDAPNANQGGDMGWFFPGGLAQQFNEVFTLPVGGVTKPVRSAGGFHIVQVSSERMHEPAIGDSYDEVHARHILFSLPESADEATTAKIQHRAATIAREMQNSSDEKFATRAKEISQGPSAESGGDLGWFKQGQMVPEFEKVAFVLAQGKTSGVVKSSFGLHIIHIIAKRHINPNAFEAHHERIQQLLLNSEMQSQVPRWIASLKAKAIIEYNGCN
ncbi:MAG: peptidylprolyl isomerase [Mariprofundaceae bacterium]